ncbi:MAG: type II secretion system protein [Patescibacteria group bacterium]|nr:type II secretion system protein [Patescibacteria group bacterium]
MAETKKQPVKKNKVTGFTLIELLVVISIIALLSSVVLISITNARERARAVAALENQRQLQKAVEMYNLDVGFYPPDVNRGWDPGISKPLPSNSDLGYDCNINPAPCTCPSAVFPPCGAGTFPLPANWMAQVQTNWRGPYTTGWPNTAPWGGKYDFNNWSVTTIRYGCPVPPGVYIGTQRNYDESNPIPPKQEQWFLDQKLDADNCLNGESQLILVSY